MEELPNRRGVDQNLKDNQNKFALSVSCRNYSAACDGRDDKGKLLTLGMYFIKLIKRKIVNFCRSKKCCF